MASWQQWLNMAIKSQIFCLKGKIMYEDIQNWFCTEAQKRHIPAKFFMDGIEAHPGFIRIPVRIEDDSLDYGDRADRMQDLEDSWNDQEPKPKLLVILQPAKH